MHFKNFLVNPSNKKYIALNAIKTAFFTCAALTVIVCGGLMFCIPFADNVEHPWFVIMSLTGAMIISAVVNVVIAEAIQLLIDLKKDQSVQIYNQIKIGNATVESFNGLAEKLDKAIWILEMMNENMTESAEYQCNALKEIVNSSTSSSFIE